MTSTLRSGLLALALMASAPAAAVPISFIPIGPVSVGAFGNLDPSGNGVDSYTFSLPRAGQVSGFVGSVGLRFLGTNLDFTSVTLNGTPFATIRSGTAELRTVDVPVASGAQLLSVGYANAQRFSSYGGVLTFTPGIAAVPEPGSWAMLILGFAITGSAMRYRRRRMAVSFG